MELRRNDCLVTHKIFRNDILATVCFTCNNNMSQRGTEKLIVNEKGIGSYAGLLILASDFHFSV